MAIEPVEHSANIQTRGGECVKCIGAKCGDGGLPIAQEIDRGELRRERMPLKLLPLLQVFFDSLCLSDKKGDMHFAGCEEFLDDAQRLLKLLSEFVVLLIAQESPSPTN